MQANHTNPLSHKITHFFSSFNVNFIAREVGAIKRKSRKAIVTDIILSYWKALSIGSFSYNKWAQQIAITIGETYSKQALWKRITPEFIDLIKILIQKSFKQKIDKFIDSKVFNFFDNVYIQDATHFKLPRFMAKHYPGSYSRYGKSSTLKIQATLNLTKGLYVYFKIASFRDNDQKESPNILGIIKRNDLIIRDLGYFVLNVFEQVIEKQAYFLSRLKYGVTLYDEQSYEKINFDKLLDKQKGKALDTIVFLGKKKTLKCRLVAIPVPEKVKNERIRKAKKDRNKATNHSKDYYKRLGYTIYITNVMSEVWSTDNIDNAYKNRWYIETLFKGWKSSLKMKTTIPERYANKTIVDFFIYANLLMINVLVLPVFIYANNDVFQESNKFISIIKLFSFIFDKMVEIINKNSIELLYKNIKYYCIYESRNDRINSLELMLI